jgi:hypothetical protein
MAEKKRPPQTGNIRIDEATSAALGEVAERTLLSKKAIATLALRAWLEANHPDVHRKLIAQSKKKA